MAKLTRAMNCELRGIRTAALEGLPASLRDFAVLSVDAFMGWDRVRRGEFTRKQLQSHIDTLTRLISLGAYY